MKNNAQNTKQNQDFPNVPANTEIRGLLKLIKSNKKKASEANPDGRTENTEKHKAEKNKYFSALATNNNNSKVFQ